MYNLPNKKNAAIYQGNNEVKYNIAGLFQCTDLIIKLIDFVKEKFDYQLPIKYIYGSLKLRWNGGRVLLKSNENKLNIHLIEKELENVISKGIIPLLTFSNIVIDKEDLNDSECNLLLELADKYKVQIIVASELLEKYIHEKYPNIKLHASVVKTSFESIRDVKYYNRLAKMYYSYVVHPDDNFNLELLKILNKNNAEIILNERCTYNCNLRGDHYKSISREQRMLSDGMYKYENYLERCIAIPEIKQSSWKKRNISLTTNEMKELADMGFKTFKIQGRTDSLYVYFFDLIRYMLENEIAFPTTYTIFLSYISDFINKNNLYIK